MAVAVVVFPGSNRDQDMIDAVEHATGQAPHVVWHADSDLPTGTDAVILPGGFSYGDYLRCGAIAARASVMTAVADAANRGMPVLGVCNGFQILIETGLLPGALMRNASLHFVCKTVELKVVHNRSPFLQTWAIGEKWTCPVAHGDGNYVCDDTTLRALQDNDQIALTYADGTNPNGSRDDIAGITNKAGNVLGMMPHPENVSLPHHPSRAGERLFKGLLDEVE
ncbi:MAG: phosphoribosylformylglycinamidine synthase subunit PurQ [Pseudomonadota bacterium]